VALILQDDAGKCVPARYPAFTASPNLVIFPPMLTYPDIDSLAFSIGPLKVHWYGLMYLFGFIGAWIYGVLRTKRADLDWTRKQVEDVIFYGALGVILGGRLGYTLFYGWDVFINDPLSIFYIWKGGMSFHGGMLGVFLAMFIYARRSGKAFFDVTDFIAPWVPIGLGAGRIGNFINGELVGRVADPDLPWAMVFPFVDQLPRHPSQLYQALTEGLLLFLILWWYSSKPRPRMAVSGVFMMCYGSFRFTTEFFRTPDAHLGFIAFDWLTMGQLLSLPMIIVGVFLFYLAMKKGARKSQI
jgi:phosphatidylglycerol:prolipoprotein diacylglycerol transferase